MAGLGGFPMPPQGGSGAGSPEARSFSVEEAKDILGKLDALIEQPGIMEKLTGLKALLTNGGDIMTFMTMVLPAIVELAKPILAAYGLPSDPFGVIQLFMGIQKHMDNADISGAFTKLKDAILTPELVELLKGMAAMSGIKV